MVILDPVSILGAFSVKMFSITGSKVCTHPGDHTRVMNHCCFTVIFSPPLPAVLLDTSATHRRESSVARTTVSGVQDRPQGGAILQNNTHDTHTHTHTHT